MAAFEGGRDGEKEDSDEIRPGESEPRAQAVTARPAPAKRRAKFMARCSGLGVVLLSRELPARRTRDLRVLIDPASIRRGRRQPEIWDSVQDSSPSYQEQDRRGHGNARAPGPPSGSPEMQRVLGAVAPVRSGRHGRRTRTTASRKAEDEKGPGAESALRGARGWNSPARPAGSHSGRCSAFSATRPAPSSIFGAALKSLADKITFCRQAMRRLDGRG